MPSEPKWTQDQLDAINARGGTVLVSAAAGSGKTAVLVERIIKRITDETHPGSVDRLLVVTFTNAAAASMKSKIQKAISKKIVENKDADSEYLRRQQMLLPLAKISTIDSFCINLVRENFQQVGVAPDFSVLESSRERILRSDAMNTVLDGFYERNPEGFERLCSIICGASDDTKLAETVTKLYDTAQSHPFPDKYLDSVVSYYDTETAFEDTPWAKELQDFFLSNIETSISCIKEALEAAKSDEEIAVKFVPKLEKDLAQYMTLKEKALCGIDELAAAYKCVSLDRAPSFSAELKEREAYIRAAFFRDSAKEYSYGKKSNIVRFLDVDTVQHKKDIERLAPAVKCLANIVREFSAEYKRLKNEENCCDFNDTLHYAVDLLCVNEGAKYKQSQLAKELSENFDEILIDEYQDVNEAQDIIFRLLSKGGSNLFMVGDVKQSIYGFRYAMPEIFLEKAEKFERYDREKDNYPSTVILGKNFRSRKGVTENINFIFNRLMFREIGGIDYNEDNYLYYAEDMYSSHTEADYEHHFIENNLNRNEAEAKYIADYIEENVGKLLVKDGEGQRPAVYGDFCVLYRSFKDEARALVSELESRGTPLVCVSGGGFFEAGEVRFMLSLLRVMNNPTDDVSLLAVMLSPVFGFTPDDLALIRLSNRDGSIYRAVLNLAPTHSKCASFKAELERLHSVISGLTVKEAVEALVEETGYSAVVSVMKNAHIRRSNLRLLAGYAERYERTGRTGISGFLHYMLRAEQLGKEDAVDTPVCENSDAVHIMTMHKSKGLEFPVVIIAATSKKFNSADYRDDSIISEHCGIGLQSDSDSEICRFDTLPYLAAICEKKLKNTAEEIRVLYVALTRAKEKLVAITTVNNTQKFVEKCKSGTMEKLSAQMLMKMDNYASMLTTAELAHPDAHTLRSFSACGGYHGSCDSAMKTVFSTGLIEKTGETPAVEEEAAEEEKTSIVSERISFVYPYSELDGIRSKRVASDFSHSKRDMTYFASSLPGFMSRNKMTPAARGTATHRFMQLIEFEKARENPQAEISRLLEEGKLSEFEAEAVEIEKVSTFLNGKTAQRILKSDFFRREYPFTCSLPAGEIQPGLSEAASKEAVIIDGIVDLFFAENGKITVLDYKTDHRVTPEILRERYTGQLDIYCRCLEQTTGMAVKEALIYSFDLGETVKIK